LAGTSETFNNLTQGESPNQPTKVKFDSDHKKFRIKPDAAVQPNAEKMD
jgi:hypothetical protein